MRSWALVVLIVASAPAAGAAQADPDRQSAIDLTRRAQEAYNEGRFQTAVELLEAAYAIFPDATLLYNLARSQESLGDDGQAAESYRRYLAARPADDNAPQARARLGVLERRIEERRALEAAANAAATSPPEVPDRPAPEPRVAPTPWPWIAAGAGAVTLGVGLGLAVAAQGRADDASSAPDHATAFPIAQEARDFETAANVTFVIGGAVLLGGALWGVLELALRD